METWGTTPRDTPGPLCPRPQQQLLDMGARGRVKRQNNGSEGRAGQGKDPLLKEPKADPSFIRDLFLLSD